jgi:hypothetical protein
LDEAPGDEGCGESGEGEVNVSAALVADRQTPELAKPGQRPFHHPPVPPELGAALDPAPRDPGLDAAAGQSPAAAAVIVGLVGVQLGRPLS